MYAIATGSLETSPRPQRPPTTSRLPTSSHDSRSRSCPNPFTHTLDDRYSDPVNHSRRCQTLDKLADDEERILYRLTDTAGQLLEAHAGEVAQRHQQRTLVADGGHR